MAEIGLIASITGCIGFGTKLAMTLYTFGDNIKSTGREVCLVHHEISLFCAVLRHIKAALDDSRDARFSTAGLLTIHEIIERCTETFKELESILLKLQSESKVDGGKPEVTFVAKVKWTFQRTRVQLLQRNIESFKNTLQLMLSTLDLSRIIHRQPTPKPTETSIAAIAIEQAEAQVVVESLLITHQVSLEDLSSLEIQALQDDENKAEHDPIGEQSREQDRVGEVTTPSEEDEYPGQLTEQRNPTLGQLPSRQVVRMRNSVFLSEVSSDCGTSVAGSVVSVVSESIQQTATLTCRWTTPSSEQDSMPQETTNKSPNSPNHDQKPSMRTGVVTSRLPQVVTPSTPPPSSLSVHLHQQRHPNSDTQQPADAAKPTSRPSTPSKPGTGASPHAFERWEVLSSHWEGLTSYWIRRLEQNTEELRREPLLQQLSRQVTDLSAAGANLFYAVVELQRLRAATERKFQRWFLETRKDAERQQEIAVALEKSLIEERKSRMDDVTRMEGSVAVLNRQTIEYKRELVSSRDESKRAWEALGRIEQETRENRKETEKRKLELEEKIRELAVQKGLAISFRKQLDTQIEDSNREITERDDLVVSLHRQLKAEEEQRINVIKYLAGSSTGTTPVSGSSSSGGWPL